MFSPEVFFTCSPLSVCHTVIVRIYPTGSKGCPIVTRGEVTQDATLWHAQEGESTAGRQFSIYHSSGKCFTPSRRALLSFIFVLSKTAVATRCMILSGETFFWKLLVRAESVSPRDMMHACKSKANSKWNTAGLIDMATVVGETWIYTNWHNMCDDTCKQARMLRRFNSSDSSNTSRRGGGGEEEEKWHVCLSVCVLLFVDDKNYKLIIF